MWWSWDLELSPHVLRRMVDRRFSEVELRAMLEDARGFRPDVVEGRYVVETRRGRGPWEVVVEPDSRARRLVVVTAFSVEGLDDAH